MARRTEAYYDLRRAEVERMLQMSTTMMAMRLNPALALSPYAKLYKERGIVQIPDIFEPVAANALVEMLAKETPWRLTFTDERDEAVHYARAEIDAMGKDAFQAKARGVMERARKNIGYLFYSYPMVEAYLNGWNPGHPIHQMTEFINGPEFLGLGRTILGQPAVNKAEALATLYAPGHFLTRHLDHGDKGERRAAYVIGLSKDWQPDWGGLLLFLNPKNDVAEGFLPRFNVITIFDTKFIHTVTQVSTFAGAGRYSIAGWFRDDPLARRQTGATA